MIAIGSDHAGYALKCEMIKHLEEKGVEFIDCGCNGESVDYPDIAEKTCEKVTSGEADKAILICGTGVGISISANKIKGIRAALCGHKSGRCKELQGLPQLQAGLCKHAGRGVQEEPVHHVHR